MIIYIEKYDSIEGFLLADFISKEDYIEFCNKIRYENYINDERTMLFIENLRFNKGIVPKEGSVYEIPYELIENLKWIKESTSENRSDLHEEAGFSNIISFRTNANYMGYSIFKTSLNSTHLKFISLPGNWNEIYDNNKCKVIYDIGASIFSTNLEIRKFVSESKRAFSDSPSLIISHWDIDHYQSLFELDKSDLGSLCCVFVPDKLITETSKRAFNILKSNCNFINVINQSPKRAIKRRISLEMLCSDKKHFAFFRGEKSKDMNKSGLALTVWNNRGCAILAADHHYSQIFSDIYKIIPQNLKINIVTPHHGGEAGKIPKQMINPILPELAVTSTGNNNYGHPKDEIRKDLSYIGFRWLRTDFEGQDILITL